MADIPFRDLAKLQQSRFDAWETRQDVIDRALLRLYKASYDETVGQMAKLYAKVGLATPEGGSYIRKEDAIRYNQFNNRLENLKAEIEGLRKKGVKLTEENSAQSIQDAYYGGQWGFEQAVSVPLPIPALPIAAIRAAVYSDVSGLDLVKTWAKNSTDMLYKTQSAMMRGLTQGYSYTKMARSIKDEFDKGLWQALRVVRTEAGRCWSEGAEEAHGAALEAGLNVRKRWSATLDKRTRPSHGRLDGTYADEQGLFWLSGASAPQPREFGVAAEDIACRCSTVDELDGISPEVRRIRNDSGKGSEILPYQKYEDWAKEKGWTPENGWKEPKTTAKNVSAKVEAIVEAKKVTQADPITYISSQRYLDRGVIESKKESLKGKEFVEIPTSYVGKIDGKEYAMVNDGHHTMEAAKELGIEVRFKVAPDPEDLVGNALLEARYLDSPYYNVKTGIDEF